MCIQGRRQILWEAVMNNRAAMLVQAARGPVLLILLGSLFAIQQAGILDFSRSWALLVIAIGVMKLIERMVAGPPPPQAPPMPPPGPGAYRETGGPYAGTPYKGGVAQ